MSFDPSTAQPLDFDPSSAQPEPEWPRDVPRPLGMAEERPAQPAGRGGLMGMLDKALGVAETVTSMLTAATSGMARGTGNALVNSAHITARKLTGQDTSGIASPGDAFEQGMAEGTYVPRTEEGKDILQGPVMRELGHIATALGPAGTPVNIARGSVSHATRAVGDARRAATAATAAKVADVVTPKLDPQKVQLARKAVDAGIPLRPDMLTDNKFVRMAGEAAENIPLTGSKKEARKTEFNKNVVRLVDESSAADKLTPEVFDGAMSKAGTEIGDIMARTDTPLESFDDLTRVARRETPDVQGVIATYIEDLNTIAAEHGGVVPGDRLRKLRTEVQTQARGTSNGDLKRTLYELAHKLDDGFAKNAPEGDLPALADARRRYAIGVSLEPLVAKSPDGSISPAQLMGRATATKEGKTRMARGRGGDMGDLARIGQAFLKEQASSGTAERNLVFKLATDAAAAAKVAATGPVAAAYNLMGPRIAKAMLEAAERRQGPKRAPPVPEGPAPLELAEGPLPTPEAPPGAANPLGDLTPDWETAPGAAPSAGPLEVVPTEGLAVPVDEATPMRLPPKTANTSPVGPVRPEAPLEPPVARRGAGSEIPAVPGRPDLPDTMIVGAPAEAAGLTPKAAVPETSSTGATGGRMLEPDTQLAMRNQRTAENIAKAEIERALPVPKGEATEIKPQVVEPAGAPKYKEPPPEKLPVGEATEIKPESVKPAGEPAKVDERLAGLERMRAAEQNETVRKVIDKRIAAVKKELADEAAATKRREDAAELRRTAAITDDPELKAALYEEAKAIEKADAIPTPKTAEGQPEIKPDAPKKIPTGKAKELTDEEAAALSKQDAKPDKAEGGDPVQQETSGGRPAEKDGAQGEDLADLDLPRIDEAFLDHQQRAHARAQPAPEPAVLERGRRQVRAALEKGKVDGTLGKDEADLALWALDKNPNLARGLRFEMATNGEKDPARAVYNTVSRIVKSFTNKESDPQRAVHEILHHSERMMPPEVQRGINREWRRALDTEIKKAKPEVAEALRNIQKGIAGGQKEFEAMKQAFADGVLSRKDHYHLTNPSEFWAVNASRILAARHTSRNAWQSKAVQWTKEMVERVKGIVGLRSDAPVLKALDDILSVKNEGVDRSTDVLKTGEKKSMLADEARKADKEQRRAKYRASTGSQPSEK